MTTSIIDYIFRELAITYLGRNDLAHVPDEDLRGDALHRARPGPDVASEEVEGPAPRRVVPAAMGAPSAGFSGGGGAVAAEASPPPTSRASRATRATPAGMRPVHDGAKRHVPEVHHLRHHHGVFVGTRGLS